MASAGTIQACLSDDSDATYASGNDADELLIGFGTFSLPSLAQVRAITPRIRMRTPIPAGGSENYSVEDGSSNVYAAGVIAHSATLATYTGVSATDGPGPTGDGTGNEWPQADLNAIQMRFSNFGAFGPTSDLVEVYLDVLYNLRPTATVTAPTGNQSTNRPTVTWTYSDPEGDIQQYFIVKIFAVGVYSAPGFNPDSATATYSTSQTSSATSWQTSVLPSGTYKAYVAVADAGAGFHFGAWAAGPVFQVVSGEGILFDVPAVPVILSAAGDTDNARAVLLIEGRDNELTRTQSTAESGPLGWEAETNVTSLAYVGSLTQGVAAINITTTAAADARIRTPAGTGGWPIVPSKAYTAQVSVASFPSKNYRTLLRWYDSGGSLLQTDTGSSVASSIFTVTTAYVNATSPPTARYVSQVIEILAAGAGATYGADKMSVAPGVYSVGSWTRGGFVVERGSLADTFSRVNSASSLGTSTHGEAWTAQAGTWGISSEQGYIVSTSQTDGSAVLTSGFLMDGVIEADVTLSSTSERAVAGLVFRAQDTNEYLLVRMRKVSGADIIEFVRRVGGVNTVVSSFTPAGLANGTTYHLAVEFFSAQVRVYLDGVLKLDTILASANVPTYANAANNLYGLYVSSGAALDDGGSRFDNFSASLIKRQVVVVERSLDEGISWTAVRSINPGVLSDPGQYGTFYDYEAPRDREVWYRAYVLGAESDVVVQSDYSQTAVMSVVIESDGQSWFKSPSNPALNFAVCHSTWAFETTSDVRKGVFRIEGRRTPVIISGELQSETMQLEIAFRNDTEYDAFEALRALQEPVLWQTCYGDDGLDQYWVDLGERKTTRRTTDDQNNNQIRVVRVNAIEVSSPDEEDATDTAFTWAGLAGFTWGELLGAG